MRPVAHGHEVACACHLSAGANAALVLPACNTEAVNLHLAEIAETVAPGAHAVFLVGQAG